MLKGVEADILEDGSLDYPPAVRRSFEFVIASVHTRYAMDAEQMTARVLRAMDDPTMTVLGHPTGRLLLSRDPFPVDLDRVFNRAAERAVAIEINADPQRLDLDWRVLRRAAAAGVTISIGADAHGTTQMDHVDLGLGIARKGWLTADRILNTWTADEFLAFAARRRA
jgi:DNA polymerase (family 10)